MSKRLVETLYSDLSGEADAVTVRLPACEFELTPDEQARLWEILGVVLPKARPAGTDSPRLTLVRQQRTNSKELTEERRRVRDWANAHGYRVGPKGVIGKAVFAAYESNTPAPGWVDPEATPAPAPVTVVKPAAKTRKAMSPAFQAAEAAAMEPVTEAPERPARALKAVTPRAGTRVAAGAPQRAATAVKTAAAAKAPRKATTTAKVSRAK